VLFDGPAREILIASSVRYSVWSEQKRAEIRQEKERMKRELKDKMLAAAQLDLPDWLLQLWRQSLVFEGRLVLFDGPAREILIASSVRYCGRLSWHRLCRKSSPCLQYHKSADAYPTLKARRIGGGTTHIEPPRPTPWPVTQSTRNQSSSSSRLESSSKLARPVRQTFVASSLS
jgi:hypothetical protein